MTDDKMALLQLIEKADTSGFLRELMQLSLQRLMEFEVEGLCGAARHAFARPASASPIKVCDWRSTIARHTSLAG